MLHLRWGGGGEGVRLEKDIGGKEDRWQSNSITL